MPNKLKNLNITKVDLVPEGANPDAFVTMYKSCLLYTSRCV